MHGPIDRHNRPLSTGYSERASSYAIEARRNAQYAVAVLRGKGRGMIRELAWDRSRRIGK